MDLSSLNEPFLLSKEHLNYYEKNGFVKLKDVLPSRVVAYFNSVITAKVEELSEATEPLKNRDTYGKAFLQLFNLWEKDNRIKELIFSPRIAKIAADLMKIDGVRLYHDQALFKEVGGGITPWHADQYYWPLASDKTVTAWIPLQATPLGMGPLEFSSGSQHIIKGRELSISDESENKIKSNLRINNLPHHIEAFDIGEVSFHSGWVFHRAGANDTDTVRKVMTVIYMDKEMKLKEPENDGQMNDWKTWCPGAKIGAIINSPLNPVLYECR